VFTVRPYRYFRYVRGAAETRRDASDDEGARCDDAAHYLKRLQKLPVDEFDRAALGGVLITLGDALAAHRYFDHAPELELIRHLRNDVAHGNRFRITKDGAERLAKWPAHNRLAIAKHSEFEVTAELNGQQVLWDFIERGDVLDLILTVSLYLIRMGNGDEPLRWP
jgi:hypothetical protein